MRFLQDKAGSIGPDERPGGRTSACPRPSVWYEIAGGVSSAEDSRRYLEHAVECAYCRPLLREAVSDFSDETTPAEEKQLANLESASSRWQRNLVQQITGKLAVDRVRVAWWRKPAIAYRLAPAVVLLAVAAVLGYRILLPPNPQQQAGTLLARAYSHKRTLKFRMEGMPYVPAGEGMQRQPETSFLSRPEALLQAEVLIAKQLAAHSSEPFWLQAKARADLMEGKYDGAIESLQHALQISPNSTEVMIDLATAYSALGKYDSAYEVLSNVLAAKPTDPVALFNRAIVGEQIHLYHQALEDAEQYLRLDPQSKWADEARALADSIRERLKKHDQSRAEPLLAPAQIIASGDDSGRAAQVDERVEQYLNEALVSWLPRAYPAGGIGPDLAAQQALFFLAKLTRERHNDLWLSDLLRNSASPGFPGSVAVLSSAVRANDAGDYNRALEHATRSEMLFLRSANTAGLMRARFEQVFARQMIRESSACADQASRMLAQLEGFSYSWLQIQIGLEHGVCSALMSAIGQDESDARRAMELADRNGYGGLYLRALSFAADDRGLAGRPDIASQLANLGLDRYWSGSFSPVRGYSLYTVQSFAAEIAHRPKLQFAVWREAVSLVDFDPDPVIRAMARRKLADAASAAEQPEIAERNYDEASRLFALAPRTAASRSSVLETQIESAQIETRFGRLDSAENRLAGIQDEIRSLSNDFLVQKFFSTLGELQLKRQSYAEAENAFRPALRLAERNLASLHSDSERLSWAANAKPIYMGLAESKVKQGQSLEAFEVFELYMGASFRDQPYRQAGVGTEEGRKAPACLTSRVSAFPPATLLSYGMLPDGLAIWLCDERGISVQWITVSDGQLQQLVQRFHDLTSDPTSDLRVLRRDARELYSTLITPVEGQLQPGRTLEIESEGVLSQIPFEALLDSRGRYLIENWSIVYSRGEASKARLHSATPVRPDEPALIVGSSTASSVRDGLLSLPNVTSEVEFVARQFRSPILLKDGDASLPNLRSHLPSAAIFHFAGHALSTPVSSGLLLSVQGRSSSLLDAAAIQRMELPNLRLAVLSACGTASQPGAVDGFESVTEAFLRRGVPRVVASRWAVNSVEARSFIEDFYRHLISGESEAEAVRQASTRMLSQARTAHPYYWAAFSSYGQP